ncbi:MAG: type II toxin-antitoxin system HicB family antitoxin [Bacillota bacterium]
MRYAVVLEKGKRNYSAYVPDLPGCVATGKTVQATLSAIREAIEFHIAGLVEDRQPVPDPTTLVDYVEVDIPTAMT